MENIPHIVVSRREEDELRGLRGWILVYGRRKTGKTFLLKRVFTQSNYFMVTRSGSVAAWDENGFSHVNPEEAVRRIGNLLRDGRVVLLDEFQRLPDKYWDSIAANHPNGRLVASGSSLSIVRRVFERKSPLLGLFSPFKVDLISYSDAVLSLSKICSSLRNALLWGLIVRDPWVIPMVSFEKDVFSEIRNKIQYFVASAPGLVGEVFEEEERMLTRVYDAVIRIVGGGIWMPAEISGVLTANNLISGGLPTVTGLLERLTCMGILEKIPLWKTRGSRNYFKHRSPLLSLVYYLDQKLNISESPRVKIDEGIILSVLGRELQFSLGEMLAEYLGGVRSYMILPGGKGDVDIVILDSKGRAPMIGYEVKIGEISESEARRSIELIHSQGIPRAGLISLSEKPPRVSGSHEELGPEELASITRKLRRGA
ncbi:MAG: ATP-binding protein [Thaumarchaeota archaeon]|jgi:predicted AAA+ superfamily ATPase|nr:ATP-binding protein [Nitrososphaerota archaeon]